MGGPFIRPPGEGTIGSAHLDRARTPALTRSKTRPVAAAAALALSACGPIDLGQGGYDTQPPPPGFATEMVAAHDAVRASAEPTPVPPLPSLGWSAAVAATAQAWASQCRWQHNPDLGSLGLGENLAASTVDRTPAFVVGMWADEARFFTYPTTCDTSGANPYGTCGHYTQLVWRDTTAVGCARAVCNGGTPPPGWSGTWYLWVCDYAPPGNWVGEQPY